MAISEDTAALVAAQLTVAWATRKGEDREDGSPAGEQITKVYGQFLEQLTRSEPKTPMYISPEALARASKE